MCESVLRATPPTFPLACTRAASRKFGGVRHITRPMMEGAIATAAHCDLQGLSSDDTRTSCDKPMMRHASVTICIPTCSNVSLFTTPSSRVHISARSRFDRPRHPRGTTGRTRGRGSKAAGGTHQRGGKPQGGRPRRQTTHRPHDVRTHKTLRVCRPNKCERNEEGKSDHCCCRQVSPLRHRRGSVLHDLCCLPGRLRVPRL
jgi:hypothetical protein